MIRIIAFIALLIASRSVIAANWHLVWESAFNNYTGIMRLYINETTIARKNETLIVYWNKMEYSIPQTSYKTKQQFSSTASLILGNCLNLSQAVIKTVLLDANGEEIEQNTPGMIFFVPVKGYVAGIELDFVCQKYKRSGTRN